jgi:hypothetical protein
MNGAWRSLRAAGERRLHRPTCSMAHRPLGGRYKVSMSMVLLHSPLVGPATMAPLAVQLRAREWDVDVPDLRAATGSSADFRAAAVEATPRGAVVVGFSGAGSFLSSLVERAVLTIYLDALVPGSDATTSPSGGFLEFIDSLPRDGDLLPPWHEWFPTEFGGAVPDDALRASIAADIPRLRRSFYDGTVPLPDGWWSRPAAYVQLSPAYEDHRARAAGYGWPVRRNNGGHLDLVTRPELVGHLVGELADPSRRPPVGDT